MPRLKSYADVPLSMAHLCEIDTPPLELIEAAAKAGLASVGLRVAQASAGGIEYPLRGEAERAAVRRRIAATGTSVLYVELISISERTRAADHEPLLETGAAIGARRLCVAGDSTNFPIVTEKFADICDLAKSYGIEVDFEFMPFRAVRTVAEAAGIVKGADRPNGHVLVDALHVFRSKSLLADVTKLGPKLTGSFQICDAPAEPPADLVAEARTNRLIPGEGGLDIWALIDAMPAKTPIGVEVPLALQYPQLSPAERLALLVNRTRSYLEQGSTR
ncbi:MAG: sugar phosphate isomerase/epimerase [Hyphomicrobiaceae bacterium]|nr:MAG: sugar phosphate isomerase/epimerase [Hyphomicrobiaceae bacterium]